MAYWQCVPTDMPHRLLLDADEEVKVSSALRWAPFTGSARTVDAAHSRHILLIRN
jgi:hypothetical protein